MKNGKYIYTQIEVTNTSVRPTTDGRSYPALFFLVTDNIFFNTLCYCKHRGGALQLVSELGVYGHNIKHNLDGTCVTTICRCFICALSQN